MIGLTVKNIIIKKQLKKKFKVPGDLFCTIFEDWTVSMRIGWFTDVSPETAVNMSYLMTKVGFNVFFSLNQSVSHHNIMLLLPYVSQLSNVTSQPKDIYGLGARLLV